MVQCESCTFLMLFWQRVDSPRIVLRNRSWRSTVPNSCRLPPLRDHGQRGMESSLDAAAIDMEYVQLHPTGFVDPANPNDSSKVLAAEVTRGSAEKHDRSNAPARRALSR